jgi:alanyl-tRNA synthetase
MSTKSPHTAAEIRNAFLRFFEERGHRRVKSSPLIPQNDPTLLFTNAGMNQFKDVFTGRETRDYSRATTSQKCVRAGGKHNDLENVGFTARHHTFFEMLGNFSFGDYFKQDAILFAWDFLTKTIALNADRLCVTVFGGDAEDGLAPDTEAEELWRTVGVRPERIFRLGKKDNFWAMGPTGPCGPCSELHLFRLKGDFTRDQIDAHAKRFYGGDESEHGSDSWMEIWNLVFMQFERKVDGGPLIPLPKPSIDTGAGLERVAAAVQDVPSNYDTDLLQPLIQKAAHLSGRIYDANEAVNAQGYSASMRVVADHARAASFLIADGVLPSNDGRGYVLRRIMRRAVRHAQRLSAAASGSNTLYAQVCAVVIETMSEAYPELTDSKVRILETVQHETDLFLRTLDRGMAILSEAIEKGADTKRVSGDIAFLLHDTYGFPLDLTQLIAAEHATSVDSEGFEKLMDEQRKRSTFVGSGEAAIGDLYKALAAELPPVEFLGYQHVEADNAIPPGGKVIAILRGGQRMPQLSAGEEGELVLDQTPFYGESGGQLGDIGVIVGGLGRAEVTDTQKPVPSIITHKVKLLSGAIRVGDEVQSHVDGKRRRGLRRHHSATHLLHRALRELLGTGVKQAGSVVAPDYLRFDYTAYQPLSDEQREQIETRVNDLVVGNYEAETRVMNPDEAVKSGAMAFFGDKYTQLAAVRVLQIGPSMELCGGTHVSRSGDIGLFKIQSEGAIAAGVRRIIAVTGPDAVNLIHEEERTLAKAAASLRSSSKEVALKTEQMLARLKEVERELDTLNKKAATAKSADLASTAREVNGVKVIAARSDSGDIESLRQLADKLRDQLQSGVVVLAGEAAGKASLLVAVTKDLTSKYKAGDLVKELSKILGGRGGGKPELAQAGGGDPSRIDEALQRAYELI